MHRQQMFCQPNGVVNEHVQIVFWDALDKLVYGGSGYAAGQALKRCGG